MADIDRLNRQLLDEIAFREDWKPIYLALNHLFDLLRQTRTRTGGDVDKIFNLELSTIQSWTETAVDFTISTPNEGVRVTAQATISLPASPADMFLCAVESETNSKVTVSGNGKTICGDVEDYFLVSCTCVMYQYFDSVGEWVRR